MLSAPLRLLDKLWMQPDNDKTFQLGAPMEPLVIEPTTNAFSVFGDPLSCRLELKGSSFPEQAHTQFARMFEWVEQLLVTGPRKLHFHMNVNYMNTVTSKCLLVFIEKLDRYFRMGREIRATWCYPVGDEDHYLVGKDFADEVSIPFEFLAV